MNSIRWGIIGCGNVTEMKSGPAFNKVPQSSLVAVMRRDREKAKDYALRHGVPRFYSDAGSLINDPDVNAVYIATPPSSHERYAVAALEAGKPVYLEKPMSTDYLSALRIAEKARQTGIKLCVAHYRRAQPQFIKIKQLLNENRIGTIRLMQLRYYRRQLTSADKAKPGNIWRIDPAVSGGGLFHDLAPHQIDLACYLFGEAAAISGTVFNQAKSYNADDIVSGQIRFTSGVIFNGIWAFNVFPDAEEDLCEIIGSEGKMLFRVFNYDKIIMETSEGIQEFDHQPPMHVQQPMIADVVQYFLENRDNPCSGETGAEVIRIMEGITGIKHKQV